MRGGRFGRPPRRDERLRTESLNRKAAIPTGSQSGRESERDPADAPAVELVGITKQFPGVLANDDISLTVRHGEVHCLLGENGAGKSTLISILSGMVRPDAGEIRVGGRMVQIDSPRAALELGVGTVYQHSTLVRALTVLENLLLGETRGLRLDVEAARARLAEVAATLGVEIDADAPAGELALGRQQQVEIVKALWRGSRVLILDEPTSMLTPQGVAELQKVLRRLKETGISVIFITHKLHEALAVADRITILRAGRVVGAIETAELEGSSAEEVQGRIVRLMFGEDARAVADVAELRTDLEGEQAPLDEQRSEAATLLALSRVSARPVGGFDPGLEEVSLELAEGEILGIAGMDGNGQRSLAEVIAGERALSAGEIRLYGVPVERLDVSARQKLGLRYVTDDRLGEGIVSSLPVSLNLFLKRIGQRPFWRHGRIEHRSVEREAQSLVKAFDVRTPSISTRAGALSGGNVQKVVLARELSFEPKVVVFNKPTYGLDLRTTSTVRDMIRGLARGGGAALVISTDLDELLDLCGRILVLSGGRLVGEVENGPNAGERVGELMVGAGDVAAA
ncbi:MAG: ABC transporter ATP-binding protein [Actinobacteria bacterium]|nr:MAG: ABC transporter ATP-binding protein [Actinomycetota bacterium]TML91244.1 MAG: ABC transporter ATP-binding protein [Actinomycetota bacterium]